MTLEVRFEDPQVPALLLEGESISVGRGAVCDRPIKHSALSYKHAEFRREGEGWVLADLGSTNGSFVGNASCKDAPQPLAAGAAIRLGTLKGKVVDPAAPAKPKKKKKKQKKKKKAAAKAAESGAGASPAPTKGSEPPGEGGGQTPAGSDSGRRDGVHPRPGSGSDRRDGVHPRPGSGSDRRGGVHPRPGSGSDRKRAPASWHVPEEERRARRTRTLLLLVSVPVVFGAVGLGVFSALPRDGTAPVADAGGSQSGTEDLTPGNASSTNADAGADADADSDADADAGVDAGADDTDTSATNPDSSSTDTEPTLDGLPPDEDPAPKAPSTEPKPGDEPTAKDPTPEAEVARPTGPSPDELARRRAIATAFVQATEAKDAGKLASLLRQHPDAPAAVEARKRFEGLDAILCLDLRGTLADGGDDVLREVVGAWTCTRGEREAVTRLDVDVVDRVLELRYSQDYTEGLGRTVGGQRLAPHPKRVTVRVFATADDEDPLATLEGETRINTVQLSPEGVTEREVWRRLLEPLGADLRTALRGS